ncbi:MAG: ABC-F family ATP-binding cassette domain-containing protein [Candidatus Glassbacteria bacterium]|nr:ABC-F family ATP-binding cassette domain-containing protein [Candidatus Glassbacteria bacterium]
MTIVSFNNISRTVSGTELFSDVTGIIRDGERIGVVGPNGSGKTTLCRLLARLDTPDSGEVTHVKNLRVHFMEQEPALDSGQGVLAELLASCSEIEELEVRIAGIQARLDSGEHLDQAELDSFGALMDRFERLGGYSIQSRAEKILTGLGLGPETFEQAAGSLSGGQKSRLSLAKSLLAQPDLLLLDEPTNHLDLNAIEFLEKLLAEISSTVVVISHDRAFLDNLTTRTIEVLAGRVRMRPENFSEFARWAAAEEERLERERKNYQRKVEQIEDFIRKNIYGQKTRQAQSRRKMLGRMQPPPETGRAPDKPEWDIEISQRSVSLVLEARGLGHRYNGAPALFEGFDFSLMRGETLAVLGANGTGKSTLLALLAGRLRPAQGTLSWGRDVTTAILPQRVERPEGEISVLEWMYNRAGDLTLGQARGLLGRFLFSGEDVEKQVSVLSEGEFRRLLLAALIHSKANLLLLDEPTNHLDIYSRQALLDALDSFPGTLVLITHDRTLLEGLATRLLEFSQPAEIALGADKVVEYGGDYSYYKRERDKLLKRLAEGQRKTSPKARAAESRSGKISAPDTAPAGGTLSKNKLRRLRERKDSLEVEIAELEERKSALQLELADPSTYSRRGRAGELSAELKELDNRITEAYGEWEKLLEYD